MVLRWHRKGAPHGGGSLVQGTGQLYNSCFLLDPEQCKNKLQFLPWCEGGRSSQHSPVRGTAAILHSVLMLLLATAQGLQVRRTWIAPQNLLPSSRDVWLEFSLGHLPRLQEPCEPSCPWPECEA